MIDERTKKRFWSKVNKRGNNECWEWTGSKSKGYGQLSKKRGKSPYKAHRLSWRIHNGEIENGMNICHKCDNPECVNPFHLFVGTQRDNIIDAFKKGRMKMYKHGLGEDNNSAKLSNRQVKKMRKDYANGATYEELSKKYKVGNVGRIVINKVYYDPNYTPINANAKPRPSRKVLSKSQVQKIKNSNLPSRALAKIYKTSKTTILQVKKGEY